MRWPWQRRPVPGEVWVVSCPDECHDVIGVAADETVAMSLAEDDMGQPLTWTYSARKGRWHGRVELTMADCVTRGGAPGVYEYDVRPYPLWT